MFRPVAVLFFTISILLQSCNSIEPPPDNAAINLSLEDVSAIEAWITLSTTNLQFPAIVTLNKNNEVGQNIILSNADTLLYIDSLSPNATYIFQASSIQPQVSSNQIQVTTMDTSSHNFTWQSWTFGEHSSSVLNDVAIIDENNIWAVGEIYMNDSLGQPDPRPYGAIYWDGNTWTPIKVPYHDFGSTNKIARPLKTIFAFDEDSIYASSSANLLKLEGNEWIEKAFFMERIPFDGQVLKMWGSSGDNIYCVGRNGVIYNYNGSNWRLVYSGTDVDIQDIWGITNTLINPFILCAASNVIEPGEHKILSINISGQVDTISWGTGRRVHSLWFNGKNQLFASGGGVFIRNNNDHWIEQTEIPLYFTERVRGKEKNDIFVVGHFGILAHYNGSSWKTYPDAVNALVYKSLDYKENLMVTVGYTQSQAVVQFMIRN